MFKRMFQTRWFTYKSLNPQTTLYLRNHSWNAQLTSVKGDNTHLCDPETLGCWSSFSAWLRAMTLSPRAKATKALQARMEHLHTRVQLLVGSSLDTTAEWRQVCWKEQGLRTDETVFHRSLTSSFQSPASSAEMTEQQTGFYQPPATSHCGKNKRGLFSASLYLRGHQAR